MVETVPRLVEGVGIEVVGVEPALSGELRLDALVEVGPQALGLGRVLGEQ